MSKCPCGAEGPCANPNCHVRTGRLPGGAEFDPTEGLPDDLAALLRDQRIIVPQDQKLFEMIYEWMHAPSDTPSAL